MSEVLKVLNVMPYDRQPFAAKLQANLTYYFDYRQCVITQLRENVTRDSSFPPKNRFKRRSFPVVMILTSVAVDALYLGTRFLLSETEVKEA